MKILMFGVVVVLSLVVIEMGMEVISGYLSSRVASLEFAPIQTVLDGIARISTHTLALFAVLVISWTVGISGLSRRLHMLQDSGEREHRRAARYLILALSVAIAAGLAILPRFYQALPIGGDTLSYISIVETMKVQGAGWVLTYTDKPFMFLFFFGLTSGLGIPVQLFFRILPALLAGLLTCVSWLYARTLLKGSAPYVAVMTALSPMIMRTSIDLYGSFIATIIFLGFLTIYFSRGDKGRSRLLLGASQLLLVVLLLSYWLFWGFLFGLLIVAATLEVQDRKTELRRIVTVFLPSLSVLGAVVVVALLYPPPVYWGLGSSFASYLGRTVTSAGATTQSSLSFTLTNLRLLEGEGNLVFFALATIGLAMWRPISQTSRFLYVWSAATLLLTLFNPFGTHAALVFPMPALAGLGALRIERMKR